MLILNYQLFFSFLHQNGLQISALLNRLFVSWALLSYIVSVSDYFPGCQLPYRILSHVQAVGPAIFLPQTLFPFCSAFPDHRLPTQADWGVLSSHSHSPCPCASNSNSHRIWSFLGILPSTRDHELSKKIASLHSKNLRWCLAHHFLSGESNERSKDEWSIKLVSCMSVISPPLTSDRHRENTIWNTVSD